MQLNLIILTIGVFLLFAIVFGAWFMDTHPKSTQQANNNEANSSFNFNNLFR